MVRMGMIGCGTMSGAYLRQMDALSDRLRFTGLVDVDLARAKAASAAATVAAGARASTNSEDIID